MADHTYNTSKMDRTPQELSKTGITGGMNSVDRINNLKTKIGFVLTPRSEIERVIIEEDDFNNERLKLIHNNNE